MLKFSSLKHNRNALETIHNSINWNDISDILLSDYMPGSKNDGADAYPPILLFKCMLLQKWFRITSDPELETQINDRISFKRFLQLPLGKQSPDHSTFSRFRGRLSKDVMDKINTEILRQFDAQGLSIKDGIMRKNTTTAKLTDYEKERNRKISKSRYIVEQYFGISHLQDAASRARFPKMIKNKIDCWLRQAAYNLRKGLRKMEALAW